MFLTILGHTIVLTPTAPKHSHVAGISAVIKPAAMVLRNVRAIAPSMIVRSQPRALNGAIISSRIFGRLIPIKHGQFASNRWCDYSIVCAVEGVSNALCFGCNQNLKRRAIETIQTLVRSVAERREVVSK